RRRAGLVLAHQSFAFAGHPGLGGRGAGSAMTVYRIRHQTSYTYEVPVLHAHHLAHLRPRRFDHQTTRRTLLEITPSPRDQHRQEDYFGNDCDVLEVLSPHERFDIIATSEVEVRERSTLEHIAD